MIKRNPVTLLTTLALLGAAALLFVWLQTRVERRPPPAAFTPEAARIAQADAADSPLVTARAERARGSQRTAAALEADSPGAGRRSGVSGESGPKGPFLRGAVFDERGVPVPGAQVTVAAEAASSGFLSIANAALDENATTDANGGFQVERKFYAGNDIVVGVRARGFLAEKDVRAPDTESGDADLGTFMLQGAAVLGGVVVDATGAPVAGAKVRRTTPEMENTLGDFFAARGPFGDATASQVETDAEGRFELAHEEVGEYVLIVRHDDYPDARYEGHTPAVGQENTGLLLQLAPTAVIAGRIRGFPAGKKHVLVRASLNGKDAEDPNAALVLMEIGDFGGSPKSKVGDDGVFEITGLDVGHEYEIQAFGSDGIFERAPCSDAKTALAGTRGLELDWDAGASIVFRVRDARTSGALADVTVRYQWDGESSGSDEPRKRQFEFSEVVLDELRPDPSPGVLNLLISVPGYRDHRVDGLSVGIDEERDLGVVQLGQAPILRVRVVDDVTGAPVRRARVALQPEVPEGEASDALAKSSQGSNDKTDADGWCELPSVATASATLTVTKLGYADCRREGVLMPTDGRREELARLTRGGAVEVLVRDSAGQPVEVLVYHEKPDGSTEGKSTDAKGSLSLKDLDPGDHRFRAERARQGAFMISGNDAAEEVWEVVHVGPSSSSSIVLRVPSNALIRGTVTAHGAAVAQARVLLLEGRESSAEDEARARMSEQMAALMPGARELVRTDRRGEFSLSDAPLGAHRLRVTRDGGGPPHVVDIDVREGENRVDVQLPGGSIEGRVVDARDVPVAGATVSARFVREDEGVSDLEDFTAMSELFGGGKKEGATTDSHGNFVIEGVSDDAPLVIEVSARGFVANRSEQVTLDESGVRRGVTIVLSAAGTIRVRLQAETRPFEMVSAEFEGEADPKPPTKRALIAQGTAVLRDLPPGPWRVRLRDDQGQLVEVRAGEEALVSLGQ